MMRFGQILRMFFTFGRLPPGSERTQNFDFLWKKTCQRAVEIHNQAYIRLSDRFPLTRTAALLSRVRSDTAIREVFVGK